MACFIALPETAAVAVTSCNNNQLIINDVFNLGPAYARKHVTINFSSTLVTGGDNYVTDSLYDERKLTVAEIGKIVGYSPATVYRHIRTTSAAQSG